MADPDDDVFAESKTEGSFDVDDKTIDESIDGQDSVSYFEYYNLDIYIVERRYIRSIIKDGIWIICI